MSVERAARCWKYTADCCRARATNSFRRGDIAYRYCDDPAHDPRTTRDHLDAIEGWVKEAAADLEMDEDVVWHDVALAYIQGEVHDQAIRAEVAQGLGLPLDVVR